MVQTIAGETELCDVLSHPRPELVRFIQSVASPLLVLGAGGKMGPTLAVMAKRAAEAAGHNLEVIAASRFTDPDIKAYLEENRVKTLVCDLMDPAAVCALPESRNIIYLVGMKFGTSINPAMTWAVNTLVPANIMPRLQRGTRMVVLSTGNVYPFSPAPGLGSSEDDPLTPIGEYSNAAVGRERICEYFSTGQGIDVALIRLFYAVELRYGVLADMARKILSGDPIDVSNSYFNCIWQGDASDMILRGLSLATSPPSAWNLCQPGAFSVRAVASELGELMGSAPMFKGTESSTALLGNSEKICATLGKPFTPFRQVLKWTAEWVKQGGRDYGKRTHFEVRNGVF